MQKIRETSESKIYELFGYIIKFHKGIEKIRILWYNIFNNIIA